MDMDIALERVDQQGPLDAGLRSLAAPGQRQRSGFAEAAVLLKTARQLQRTAETQSLAGSAAVAVTAALIPVLVLSAVVIELAELGSDPARG